MGGTGWPVTSTGLEQGNKILIRARRRKVLTISKLTSSLSVGCIVELRAVNYILGEDNVRKV